MDTEKNPFKRLLVSKIKSTDETLSHSVTNIPGGKSTKKDAKDNRIRTITKSALAIIESSKTTKLNQA